MTTQKEVLQVIGEIDAVWGNHRTRPQSFGDALTSVEVRDIRGLNLVIDLHWPVCAMGGTNGSGKTTLLQLFSSAYTKEGTVARHYTLNRWVGQSIDALAESQPVGGQARVVYRFFDSAEVDIPYVQQGTRWRYPRRGNPERHVEFIGTSRFAPRIERTDRTHQHRLRLERRATENLTPQVIQSIARILGKPYTEAKIHTVSAARAIWTDEIVQVSQNGVSYTDAHMGAGEQKVLRLVRHLEQLPPKSLILLEEPELTLHPDAQFGLAWYLMTLSKRRGHQIVIATHSHYIFEALPKAARIVLSKSNAGTIVVNGAPMLSVARALAPNTRANKHLLIVEDVAAARLLAQILERFSSDLVARCEIVPVGSTDDVRRFTLQLRLQNVRAIGVRDPDIGADPAAGLFSLPGRSAPEVELLSQENIRRTESFLNGFTEAYERAAMFAVGMNGASRAKKIMQTLPLVMEREATFIADRLVIAWLSDEENSQLSRQLVATIDAQFAAD